MSKNFILDTCVLIHDPSCVFHFGEHNVWIPLEVIKELDRIKGEGSERGQAARAAQRTLLAHLPEEPGKLKPIPSGGQIGSLLPPNKDLEASSVMDILGDRSVPDHRIIATAKWFEDSRSKEAVILVTKDMGMAIKARMCGVTTEDYRHDKIQNEETPAMEIPISSEEAEQFLKEEFLELDEKRLSSLENLPANGLATNAYGLFNHGKRVPWRHTGFGRFVPLNDAKIQVPGGINLRARNLEQVFFMDALLNPEINLITASGPAGTGKTLLAMAAALQQVGSGEYTGVSISKAIESVGKANGFLPGNIEEKMRPWLQPYADALNFLHRPEESGDKRRKSQRKNPIQTQVPKKTPYDALTENGTVEITAIEHIRGRSIPKRFLIIDEVQNIPLLIVKTITTRLAEGSKIVFLGDPEQIDNPHLDRYSNGLAHLRSKMGNLPIAAHVQLKKGERSLLAEQASKLL